jgi:hypothetical protein
MLHILTLSVKLYGILPHGEIFGSLSRYLSIRFRFSRRFEASLIGQFDQAEEHNKANRLAFNNQFDSVRVGPQLAVNLIPNTSADTPYAKGLSASLMYPWAYETIGDKALPLFTANINYTLDEAKHFALSATYQRGYDENTGIYMNQYLIGLAAKY